MYNCVSHFCIYLCGLSLNGWHALLCITNNRQDVTIATHAVTPRPYVDDDGETTYETPIFLCFNLEIHIYLCLLLNETKNLLMGDKTIPDSAEPRL